MDIPDGEMETESQRVNNLFRYIFVVRPFYFNYMNWK